MNSIIECVEIFPSGLADNQRAYLMITSMLSDAQGAMDFCPIFPRVEAGQCESRKCVPWPSFQKSPYSTYFTVTLTYAYPVRISKTKKPGWFRRLFQ